jgi:hypothetical protein
VEKRVMRHILYWNARLLWLSAGAVLMMADSVVPAVTFNQTSQVEVGRASSVRSVEHIYNVQHCVRKKKLANDDNSIGSEDNISYPVDVPPEGWITTIITEVMESWPLQLRFLVNERVFIVELSDKAVIESATTLLSPGDLAPGDQVKMLVKKSQIGGYQIMHVKKI